MLQKSSYLVLTVTALLLAYASLTGRLSRPLPAPEPDPTLAIGAQAPPLMLRWDGGDSVPAVVPGRETLVVFFSTSCPWCLLSLPTYRELVGKRCDLAFSFVVLDRPAREVNQWWSENAWPRDARDVCATVIVASPTSPDLGRYGRPATPTAYLFDRGGSLLRSEVGAMQAVPEWLELDGARLREES